MVTVEAAAGETRWRAFVADVRALPRAAWIIYLGTFINRFGSFVLTFLILFLIGRGYSPAQAGVALTAYGLGSVAAAAAGGHLADRLGRRRTIALSMFCSAAVLLALWRAEQLWAIVALAGLSGLAGELYRPAASALLADVTPAGRRVVTFALYRLAVNTGFAFGPAVAGYFATRSFTFVFVGDAITSVLYGLLVLFAIPAKAEAEHRSASHAAAPPAPVEGGARRLPALRLILADRALLAVLLAASCLSLVYHQAHVSLPLETRARGLSPGAYGFLASLNGVFCLLLELPIAAVTARVAAWLPMVVGAVLIGAGFGATALAPTVPLLALTVLVWSVGEMVYYPVVSAYVADLAPPGLQGRYQATLGFTGASGLVLGPAVGPLLFQWSSAGLWSACAVLGVLAALLFASVRPARPRR